MKRLPDDAASIVSGNSYETLGAQNCNQVMNDLFSINVEAVKYC